MHRGRRSLPRCRTPARMRVVPPAGRMPPELQQRSQRAERRHDPSALGVHAAAAAGGGGAERVRLPAATATCTRMDRRAPCATPPAVRSRESQRMPEWQKPAGGRMVPPYRYGEGVHAAGRHGAGRSCTCGLLASREALIAIRMPLHTGFASCSVAVCRWWCRGPTPPRPSCRSARGSSAAPCRSALACG